MNYMDRVTFFIVYFVFDKMLHVLSTTFYPYNENALTTIYQFFLFIYPTKKQGIGNSDAPTHYLFTPPANSS